MSQKGPPSKLPGRLVVIGMLFLFIAMGYGLASVATIGKPISHSFMFFAKVFGFLWLPFIGLGILARIGTNSDEHQKAPDNDVQPPKGSEHPPGDA
jgi:hypothetical protein